MVSTCSQAKEAQSAAMDSELVLHCQYKLDDLLLQYKNEAEEAGVDLISDECDLATMSVFDSVHLQHAVREDTAHSNSKSKTPLGLPGVGDAWSAASGMASSLPTMRLTYGPAESSSAPTNVPRQTTAPTPGSKASQKKAKNWKPSRRGKKASRPRGGTFLQESGGDAFLADTKQLRAKLVRNGSLFRTRNYSLENNGSHVSTGWQGLNPPPRTRSEIRSMYSNGTINSIVATFFPVAADLQRPAILLDQDSRIFLFRTAQFGWLKAEAGPFHEASHRLLKATLSSQEIKEKSLNGVRGPHFPCIIGHHRQYSNKPCLTRWHRDNILAVEEFMRSPLIQKITNHVSSVVRLMFPGVAERFLRSARWHEEKHGIVPLFGLFWNFCINGLFPGQKRVHCQPHADAKNIVGVCVLVIYELPGKTFNHAKRSWLVLWEAGVAIQLPPWTMVAYPSALLYHFNIDITDFKFVTTNENERPSPNNSRPIEEGDDEGRGSLVYFNQASMHRCSEMDSETVAEGIRNGHSGKADYPSSIQEALLTLGTRSSILP